jgi:hypothetical protein
MADKLDYLIGADGQIRHEFIDDLIVEVVSGRSIFESSEKLFATRVPTLQEQDNARIVFRRRLHDARKTNLPSRAEVEAWAIEHGVFPKAEREEAASLTEVIKKTAEARERTTDPAQKVELTAEIERMSGRLTEIRLGEEEVFAHTAEAKAEEARIGYLVSQCTLGGELLDVRVWETWDKYLESDRWELLLDARRSFMRVSNGLPIKIIRAVARHSEWQSRWKAARESGVAPFDGNSADWDANKRNLAWWTDFYDALRRMPEPPPEPTLADDDSLQIWINQMIQKRQQQQNSGNGGGKAPPTYIDGSGQRRQMQRTGTQKIQVNQPTRVRV